MLQITISSSADESDFAEPVPDDVRTTMRDAYGVDVGDRVVHRGPSVSDEARNIGALAFTRGGDVLLGDIRFRAVSGDAYRAYPEFVGVFELLDRSDAGRVADARIVRAAEVDGESLVRLNQFVSVDLNSYLLRTLTG